MRFPVWIAAVVERASPRLLPLGQRGERAATRYLKSRGYRIVATGYRSRYGEIDVIAVDAATVVFVEVKTRRPTTAGEPHEAVHSAKQERLVKTALDFLKRRKLLECRARFDIISVVWTVDSAQPHITHYADAFRPGGHGQSFV